MDLNINTYNEAKNLVVSHLNTILLAIYNEIVPENTSNFDKKTPNELVFHFLMALMIAGIVGVNILVLVKRHRHVKRIKMHILYNEVEQMLARETDILSGMLRCGKGGDDNDLFQQSERIISISVKLCALQKMSKEVDSSIFNKLGI